MSEAVGIRALQQNASAVIGRVEAGEVVEVTDRGRPVARIVPHDGRTLVELVAAGLARRARRSLADLPAPLPRSGLTLASHLGEAREDER